jgi:hypothetical protein
LSGSAFVGLPDAVARDDLLTIEVVYGGRLESQELDREAIAPQGQSQRQVDAELVVLEPEPRFLYSNRVAWYPQGSTTDYATAEMRFTVPSEQQVVASGSLLRAVVVPNQDPRRSGSVRARRRLSPTGRSGIWRASSAGSCRWAGRGSRCRRWRRPR